MIVSAAEHTINDSLLTDGGVCIDVGCLGFEFSKMMKILGQEVYAYDIQDLEVPANINFIRGAVCTYDGKASFDLSNDKQANNVINGGSIEVDAFDINTIYATIGKPIDILKLDCEGSEYFILSSDKFQPIPQQISVEFHEHCQKDLHDLLFDKCIENLLKYYNPIKMDRYAAHGAGFNYWDCLFVKK